MIKLIEAKNYRSLKYISRPLNKFQVLIGPNASGKTTFLDVINFVSDIISTDIDEAIYKRSSNYDDLTFNGNGEPIEFAIEAEIPEEILNKLPDPAFKNIRYEIKFGLDKEINQHTIFEENVTIIKDDINLKKIKENIELQFPRIYIKPGTIIYKKGNEETLKNIISEKKGDMKYLHLKLI